MMMRDKLSQDWPKYLELTVKALNARHIKALGGFQPGAHKI